VSSVFSLQRRRGGGSGRGGFGNGSHVIVKIKEVDEKKQTQRVHQTPREG